MLYNKKYYDGVELNQLRPKAKAFKTMVLTNGIVLALFQGSRGSNPDLDFVVKILRPGSDEKPEAPMHTYWVVDLIIKSTTYAKEVGEIIDYYIDFYNKTNAFKTKSQRNNYKLQTVGPMVNKYSHISTAKSLSIDYVATIIELFCKCEKQNSGAHMFIDLLHTIKKYTLGTADYMHVIKASMPMRR